MHKCNPLSHEDRIWIAAFWDAEGSVQLTKTYSTRGTDQRKTPYLCARVRISQKEREVLDWIHETTGIGNVYRDPPSCFTWVCSSRQAVSFLYQIEGWVKTKNHIERMEEVLAYYEEREYA